MKRFTMLSIIMQASSARRRGCLARTIRPTSQLGGRGFCGGRVHGGGVRVRRYSGIRVRRGAIRPLRAAGLAPAELKKPAPDPYNVKLSATAKDQSVLVRWDHDSEAVKTATP